MNRKCGEIALLVCSEFILWIYTSGVNTQARREKTLVHSQAEVISESELLSFCSAAVEKHKGTHRLKQMVNKCCEITQ